MKKQMQWLLLTAVCCLLLCLLAACAQNTTSKQPAMSPVPQALENVLTPEAFELLGKPRHEIRPRYRMETSENDFSFWYSGLGIAEDGTEGNVYISYTQDGMSYDGLCDYISGEIERISFFEKGTTIAQFEETVEPFLSSRTADGDYRIDDFVIFVETEQGSTVITRLTIQDQPA